MIDIAEASRLWHLLDVTEIADTPGSRVYRARTSDNIPVIAKLLKPLGMGELPGMDFLAWRQGHGAVRLLARQDNGCLLGDAGSQTLEDFRREHGEASANDVFAGVLTRLHAPSALAPPRALTPLARHFRQLTERSAPVHPDDLGARGAEDLGWAADLARRLLADQMDIRPLHGDLHHENIISPDGVNWLAIDPHGLIGDPAYDSANFFGNPLDSPDIVLDRDRITGIARRVAPAIGCSERKILEYAAAHAALSACWSIDDPVSEADSRDALHRLAFVGVVRQLLIGENGYSGQ